MNCSVLSEREKVPSKRGGICIILGAGTWKIVSDISDLSGGYLYMYLFYIYMYLYYIYMLLKGWNILSFLGDSHLKKDVFARAVRSGCYLESAGSLSGLGKSKQRSCLFFIFFALCSYKSSSFFSPTKMDPGCFLHKRRVITC